jgi:hypothetical protein
MAAGSAAERSENRLSALAMTLPGSKPQTSNAKRFANCHLLARKKQSGSRDPTAWRRAISIRFF